MAAALFLTHPTTISWPRSVLYGMEIFFWIIYFFSCAIFLKLLRETKSIHRNLRCILANMCIDYVIAGITRFFILYDHYNLEKGLNPTLLYAITLLGFVGLTAKTASEFMLLIERCASTVLAYKYEKLNSTHHAVIFVALCYLYPCVTLPLLVGNQVTKKVFTPMPIIFDICSWIFTLSLLKRNRNNYVLDYNSLTNRYQTVENIRTLRAIVWFLIYSTVSNAITVSFHAFITEFFNENSDKETYALCSALWYTINVIVATLLPLPFILKHDDMRKHFMALIRKNTTTPNSNIALPFHYKTVTGSQMNMNNDADTHFNNLKSLWMEHIFEGSSTKQKKQDNRALKYHRISQVAPIFRLED